MFIQPILLSTAFFRKYTPSARVQEVLSSLEKKAASSPAEFEEKKLSQTDSIWRIAADQEFILQRDTQN